jgi:hypothetical protein
MASASSNRHHAGEPLSAPALDDLAAAYRAPEAMAGHQMAEAVVTDRAAFTVLCSETSHEGREHTMLVTLDGGGAVLRQRMYPPARGAGRAIATLPSGGLVIAGEASRRELTYNAHVMCVDAGGEPVSEADVGAAGNTGFVSVTILDDGSVLTGGTTRGSGWVARLDAALEVVWEHSVDFAETVVGVAALQDGGFSIAGSSDTSTVELGFARFARFGRDGRSRWRRRLPSKGRGEPAAIAAMADDGIVAVGHCPQLWAIRLDESGATVWESLLGDTDCRGRAVAARPDGGVVVAGDRPRDGGREIQLACLAAGGTVAWSRILSGDCGYDVAHGLAAADDGGVLVAGSTMTGAEATRACVWRLSPHGEVVWRWISARTDGDR